MADGMFGPYRVQGLLGRGGMGEVYRAYDTVRDRTVALKLLPERLADDPSFVARFQREARVAARVTDPHLVPVHDFGEINGRLYIDMALIEGDDLDSVLEHGGPLRPADAVGVLEQVAGALDAVHAAGLVHRDIKPSNVLLTAPRPGRRRFAYLSDFGIVRPVVTNTGSDLTGSQATVGTLQYMAPERFVAGGGDHLSDIYALACVLYECLTGRRPFPGDDIPALIAAHLNHPPPRPSAVRPALAPFDQVVAVGMAKEPGQRYSSAGELMMAAERALAGPTAHVTALGPGVAPRPAHAAGHAAAAGAWPGSAVGFAAQPTATAPPPAPISPPPPAPVHPPTAAPRPARRWPVIVLGGVAAALAVALAVTVVVLVRQQASGPSTPTTEPPVPTSAAPLSPVVESSTVGQSIPDEAPEGVTDSVRLSGGGTVNRLLVRVAITHPVSSDLDIILISPTGRRELISDNRDFGTSVQHTFDTEDSADTDGTGLANFVGEPYEGEWKIIVADTLAADVGEFESWSIEVHPA